MSKVLQLLRTFQIYQQMKKINKGRPGGNVEIDELRFHFADKFGMSVRVELPFAMA